MTSAVSHISSRAIQVIVGIDTHQDQHVAVAVDQLGIRLNEYSTPATTWGYGELERWARDLGQVLRIRYRRHRFLRRRSRTLLDQSGLRRLRGQST